MISYLIKGVWSLLKETIKKYVFCDKFFPFLGVDFIIIDSCMYLLLMNLLAVRYFKLLNILYYFTLNSVLSCLYLTW